MQKHQWIKSGKTGENPGMAADESHPQFQKYKGRVVLRGDFVKDNSGLTQYSLNKDHQHLK